jgi:hypothetical protein
MLNLSGQLGYHGISRRPFHEMGTNDFPSHPRHNSNDFSSVSHQFPSDFRTLHSSDTAGYAQDDSLILQLTSLGSHNVF